MNVAPFVSFVGGVVDVNDAEGRGFYYGIFSIETAGEEVRVVPWWAVAIDSHGQCQEIDPVPVVVGNVNWKFDPRSGARLEISNPENPTEKSFFVPQTQGRALTMVECSGITPKNILTPPKV